MTSHRSSIPLRGIAIGALLALAINVLDVYATLMIQGSYMTLNFSTPGALYASNEYGIPGVAWFPVTVHPPQGGYVLSAWVKDSYVGPLKGYLRKQVLIDGKVVWEDDLEGDEGGWQHLVLDVSRWVAGRKVALMAAP